MVVRNYARRIHRVRELRLFSGPGIAIVGGVLIAAAVLLFLVWHQSSTRDKLGTAVAVADQANANAEAAGAPTVTVPTDVRNAAPTSTTRRPRCRPSPSPRRSRRSRRPRR